MLNAHCFSLLNPIHSHNIGSTAEPIRGQVGGSKKDAPLGTLNAKKSLSLDLA